MSLDTKKIKRSLKKKGFAEDRDGPHIKYVFQRENLTDSIATHVSHGSKKTISKGLVAEMAKQCRLNPAQFRELIDCTMSQNAYIDVLASSAKENDKKKSP